MKTVRSQLSELDKKIYDCVRHTEYGVTVYGISRVCKISWNTAKRHVDKLVDQKVLNVAFDHPYKEYCIATGRAHQETNSKIFKQADIRYN